MTINSTVSSIFFDYSTRGLEYDFTENPGLTIHILSKDGLELGRLEVVGGTEYTMTPSNIEGEERAALWAKIEDWTKRRIAQEQFMEQELEKLKAKKL